jgi:glycosyltransferase involved in cell wall biosynthesis
MSSAPQTRVAYFYDVAVPSQLAAPIQILNTCHALCRLGATVTVFTNRLAAPELGEALAFYGLAPHPGLAIVPWYATGRPTRGRVCAALEDNRFDLVLSRGEPGLELFGMLPRELDARLLFEAHRLCFTEVAGRVGGGLPPPLARALAAWRTARTRRQEGSALNRADGVICLTRGVQEALQGAFDLRAPSLVLPSGVELPPEAPPGDEARDVDVFYAGKLERRKGLHDLIAAMAHLPQARLLIAGGAPEEIAPWRTVAEGLGVAGRVTFTGYVAPAAVGELYRRARVGVCALPTGESAIAERYTSPLKLLEMMAHGAPVVATDVPALREILDERTASLVPPNRPELLAAAIGRLLADRTLARRQAHAARARCESYSWEARARRLLEFAATL